MELDIEIDYGISGDGKTNKTEKPKIDELGEIGLFKDADLKELESLIASGVVMNLSAGQALLKAGQLNPKVYFLIEGQLKLYNEASKNKAFGVIDMGQGAGFMSAIEQKPSPESVVASEDSRVLVMDLGNLIAMSNKSHAVAKNFAVILFQYIRGQYYLPLDGSANGKHTGRISYIDELTGLHNKRWLNRMLPRLIMRASKDQKPFSVILCDIDKFKTFNEDFGESLENQALVTVAQIMLENARPTDMIARYDLDAFLLILPETDIQGARALATRLRDAVCKTNIVIPNECVLPPVTMSFGLKQLKGFVSESLFVEQAKQVLQKAKKSGGNWISDDE
ncbi:MAG: GGDEF domain-containing protein [Gammaproteobacteria bacterium]|nr:GGDEF domain-containing protein [Gammaproteobacteria bacterium]